MKKFLVLFLCLFLVGCKVHHVTGYKITFDDGTSITTSESCLAKGHGEVDCYTHTTDLQPDNIYYNVQHLETLHD